MLLLAKTAKVIRYVSIGFLFRSGKMSCETLSPGVCFEFKLITCGRLGVKECLAIVK